VPRVRTCSPLRVGKGDPTWSTLPRLRGLTRFPLRTITGSASHEPRWVVRRTVVPPGTLGWVAIERMPRLPRRGRGQVWEDAIQQQARRSGVGAADGRLQCVDHLGRPALPQHLNRLSTVEKAVGGGHSVHDDRGVPRLHGERYHRVEIQQLRCDLGAGNLIAGPPTGRLTGRHAQRPRELVHPADGVDKELGAFNRTPSRQRLARLQPPAGDLQLSGCRLGAATARAAGLRRGLPSLTMASSNPATPLRATNRWVGPRRVRNVV